MRQSTGISEGLQNDENISVLASSLRVRACAPVLSTRQIHGATAIQTGVCNRQSRNGKDHLAEFAELGRAVDERGVEATASEFVHRAQIYRHLSPRSEVSM